MRFPRKRATSTAPPTWAAHAVTLADLAFPYVTGSGTLTDAHRYRAATIILTEHGIRPDHGSFPNPVTTRRQQHGTETTSGGWTLPAALPEALETLADYAVRGSAGRADGDASLRQAYTGLGAHGIHLPAEFICPNAKPDTGTPSDGGPSDH